MESSQRPSSPLETTGTPTNAPESDIKPSTAPTTAPLTAPGYAVDGAHHGDTTVITPRTDRQAMNDDQLDAVLAALRDVVAESSPPVATTPDVVDALGDDRKRRRVFDDLTTLERAGEVTSKKVGAKARVWAPVNAQAPTPTQAIESPTRPATPDSDDDRAADRDRDRGQAPVSDDVVDDVDLPGERRDVLADRRDALRAALDYLYSEGEAYRRDFQADVYPDHPAGYETESGWWNAIQPALREIAESDDRIQPADTRTPWRWTE